MEKLTAIIQTTKVKPSTKKAIIEMAEIKRRKIHEFIRVSLEILEEDYKNGIWEKERY